MQLRALAFNRQNNWQTLSRGKPLSNVLKPRNIIPIAKLLIKITPSHWQQQIIMNYCHRFWYIVSKRIRSHLPKIFWYCVCHDKTMCNTTMVIFGEYKVYKYNTTYSNYCKQRRHQISNMSSNDQHHTHVWLECCGLSLQLSIEI